MGTAFVIAPMHPAALFGAMFFIGAGNGLVLPSGIACAVSVKPEVAGARQGLPEACRWGSGALVAPFTGAMFDATV
jgi:DHA1 family bicyclomycin/chloramphenicol resistance-like MFS transporter